MMIQRYLKYRKYSLYIKLFVILCLFYGCFRILFSKQRFVKYYDDGLRSSWYFNITRNYSNRALRQWTEPIEKRNFFNFWTPGENGRGYKPPKGTKDLMDKLLKEHNFNVMASNAISLRRTLPDVRFSSCHFIIYPEQLPTTSVIIVVHNEIWSMLLRTVWSIIDRSPRELLKEIIIVDDASTWTILKKPLVDYVSTLPANIRIIRTERREGLIRARIIGARNARGSVLTFLDAHIECTKGWLQPLLSRIANDRSVAAVPLIDYIGVDDMRYNEKEMLINGLHWSLQFDWSPIPKRELIRTKYDNTAPIRTPTHIGCAFAIDREFFFEIGSFDEGMHIWGSENVEISFRVWMCGGALEIIPCSRVGHLFRISTYSFEGDQEFITMRNDKRLIEVWMDEFKDYIYTATPRLEFIRAGDLTERMNIRKQLKCKSFRWYLENIYPESVWLTEFISIGNIKSTAQKVCLNANPYEESQPLTCFPCHDQGELQFFTFSKIGIIRTLIDLCIGISQQNKLVITVKCSKEDKSQRWIYNRKELWIVHLESSLCLGAIATHIVLLPCDSNNHLIKWDLGVVHNKMNSK